MNFFYHSWDRITGGQAAPVIRVLDDIDAHAPLVYNKADREIRIARSTVNAWGIHGNIRARMVQTGFFPPHTNSTMASILHEAAHDVVMRISQRDRERLWDAVFNSYKTWPVRPPSFTEGPGTFNQRLRQWMADPKVIDTLYHRVSIRGAAGPDEFLAEAFSEYMTAPRNLVRPVANAVGDWMTERMARPIFGVV